MSNTLLLRGGSLGPEEGKVSLVVPIIRASRPQTKVTFHHAKAEPKPDSSEELETLIYILEPNMCIRVIEGELLYISVYCK